MIIILEKIFFFIFLLIVASGIGLKLYTRKRLRDIDGMSPIIRQNLEEEHIIGEFGEDP